MARRLLRKICLPPIFWEPFKVLECLLVFCYQLGNQFIAVKIHCALGLNLFCHHAIYNRKCPYLSFENSTPPQLKSVQCSLLRLWQLENEELETFFNTIAQFTNVQNIYCSFYKWKTMGNHQKKFILQLAIVHKFFHPAFFNPYCQLLFEMARRCNFKGLSQDGGQADFF